MSTKPRERILLLAIVLGVVAATMLYSYLRGQTTPKATNVSVVVPASNIPKDARLTADMLKMSEFPANLVPPGSATSQAGLVGMVTLTDLKADQPIQASSIRRPGTMRYLVPPGMRAVTIGIDQVTGVAGFLQPDNRVDVIATFDVGDGAYTRTVLQNVMLIAIDSRVSESGESQQSDKVEAKPATTATLAVLPHDAEKLILADSKGKLRLALRSWQDNSIVTTRPLSSKSVIGVAPSKSSTASARPAGSTGRDPGIAAEARKFWEQNQQETKMTENRPPITPIVEEGKTIEIYRGTEKTVEIVKN